MRWHTSLRTAAATFVVVLVACLPATATTPAQNRSAAVADAGALVAAADLPDGATTLPSEPVGDGGVLANPPGMVASPNLVTRTAFFRVGSQAQDVLTFIAAHPPTGAVPDTSGSADARDGHSYDFRGFRWPSMPGRLGLRSLTYSVARLDDGRTGIRVDAQVLWITPRPAADRIPRSARYLTITSGQPPLHVSAGRAHELARLLNQLDVVQPGARACPLFRTGAPVPRLVFRARAGGRVLATAVIHSEGCPSVDTTVGGRRMPALDLTDAAGTRLLATLRQLHAL